MKQLQYIIFTLLLIATGCDQVDYEFSEYSKSPIKSVSCTPLFTPLPVQEGSAVVTIVQNPDDSFSFFKVDKDGTVTTKDFSFSWINELPASEINITQYGQFRKNTYDEYYLEYYYTNTFGKNYYGVIKFDNQGNVMIQIDGTADAIEGAVVGHITNVPKIPVNGTPLNNGGYAMILQTPSMGMLQASATNLTLLIIDRNGNVVNNYNLARDEYISIEKVSAVGNNIAIFYNNADKERQIGIFNSEGQEVKTYTIDPNLIFYNYQIYSQYLFISGKQDDVSHFWGFDGQFNLVMDVPSNKIIVSLNITYAENDLFFSGFTTNNLSSDLKSLDSYYEYVNNLNGFALSINTNSQEKQFDNTVTMDYNNGVMVYATFRNGDGTYTLFLTQVTPISMLASPFGDKIYIYNTDDVNKLQIN